MVIGMLVDTLICRYRGHRWVWVPRHEGGGWSCCGRCGVDAEGRDVW